MGVNMAAHTRHVFLGSAPGRVGLCFGSKSSHQGDHIIYTACKTFVSNIHGIGEHPAQH